ncbi:MAG: hypothetical protein M1819_006887 [Sarea resinae]|nr:MAG: hypothetical protein M1819_006887 [Sarea resinae]
MPFRFSHLCDLLSEIEELNKRDPPLLPIVLHEDIRKAIYRWFGNHRKRIDSRDTNAIALLSALFPERRTDRVYGLKEKSLVKVVSRCLRLGVERQRHLNEWQVSGGGDLGECVERIQRQAEMPVPMPGSEVTLEEIDLALNEIAARHRYSSPAVRAKGSMIPGDTSEQILEPLFHRLSSRDAKWLTRMILKDYSPVLLPEALVLKLVHFLLPDLLQVQASFEAAVGLLRGPMLGRYPSQPGRDVEDLLRDHAAKALIPTVGVKVGRVPFLKARSTKHCAKMAGIRRMSMERKYDGEYCQIHIDLAKGPKWIQIFSKSGKDSTMDRRAIHSTIRSCLRIDHSDCNFVGRCILEGELVVYSDKDKQILGFHKLRKHVARTGTFLGTEQDSPPQAYEHLMLIFFDVLLIDNDPVLNKRYSSRRNHLISLINPSPGRAAIAEQEDVHFSSPDALKRVRKAFGQGIVARWEGFVLKPFDEPYFPLKRGGSSQHYAGCWIKLKKDYITGLGDTADLAVIGASYDGTRACQSGKNALWTRFYIGCLENKEEVVRFHAKPHFKVLDALSHLNKHDLKEMNELGKFRARPAISCSTTVPYDWVMATDMPPIDSIFTEPFVLEVMGSGFHKPQNSAHFTLRFPRVLKIHWDRNYKDAVSFAELQQMAKEAMIAPEDSSSQEETEWIAKLERADYGHKGERVSSSPDKHDMDPLQLTNVVSPSRPERAPAPDLLLGASSKLSSTILSKSHHATSSSAPLPVTHASQSQHSCVAILKQVNSNDHSLEASNKRNHSSLHSRVSSPAKKRPKSTVLKDTSSSTLNSPQYPSCPSLQQTEGSAPANILANITNTSPQRHNSRGVSNVLRRASVQECTEKIREVESPSEDHGCSKTRENQRRRSTFTPHFSRALQNPNPFLSRPPTSEPRPTHHITRHRRNENRYIVSREMSYHTPSDTIANTPQQQDQPREQPQPQILTHPPPTSSPRSIFWPQTHCVYAPSSASSTSGPCLFTNTTALVSPSLSANDSANIHTLLSTHAIPHSTDARIVHPLSATGDDLHAWRTTRRVILVDSVDEPEAVWAFIAHVLRVLRAMPPPPTTWDMLGGVSSSSSSSLPRRREWDLDVGVDPNDDAADISHRSCQIPILDYRVLSAGTEFETGAGSDPPREYLSSFTVGYMYWAVAADGTLKPGESTSGDGDGDGDGHGERHGDDSDDTRQRQRRQQQRPQQEQGAWEAWFRE